MAKSVRSHVLTFGIFENRNAVQGSYEDLIIGARAGAGVAGACAFCLEPEPEPPNSLSRSRSRNVFPEPEPTKNVTAPHPCLEVIRTVRIKIDRNALAGSLVRMAEAVAGIVILCYALLCYDNP